jgi:hypothetical protein
MSMLSGMGGPGVDFNYFLERKYAQLQQQADATTSNAASTAITANASANASAAAAGLDAARTKVLPAESAAAIGLQGAQAGLLRTQASVLPGTAASENALRAGQLGQINEGTTLAKTLRTTGLFGGSAGSMPTLAGALGVTGPTVVRGPTDTLAAPAAPATAVGTATGILPTAQRIGESHDQWVARLRGLGYGG